MFQGTIEKITKIWINMMKRSLKMDIVVFFTPEEKFYTLFYIYEVWGGDDEVKYEVCWGFSSVTLGSLWCTTTGQNNL